MTHEGILKVNEFFNNKLSKSTDNIKTSITYVGNFGNTQLFQNLRKVVKRVGYEDVKGQIDTLYCIVDAIKNNELSDAIVTAALSGTSRTYLSTKDTIDVFKNVMGKNKITFDDRIRRDNAIALYLTSSNFCIKTKFFTMSEHRELFKSFIDRLISLGLFICKQVEFKTDSSDLYHQVYDNSKSVMTNMHSRGMSLFAIACYFWSNNRDLTPKPFMNNWSGLNFMQALSTTSIYKSEASETIKQTISNSKPYWAVLAELSLMTGKVTNIDENRKALNQIINHVLDSEGEEYIRSYLRQLKLVGSQNPIQHQIVVSTGKDALKSVEKALQNQLRERTTPIPTKELIVESIKYQFMISRILDIDFSSKRKDHIVFDKTTRKRVFDIL